MEKMTTSININTTITSDDKKLDMWHACASYLPRNCK